MIISSHTTYIAPLSEVESKTTHYFIEPRIIAAEKICSLEDFWEREVAINQKYAGERLPIIDSYDEIKFKD
jgi:hypothetical protein